MKCLIKNTAYFLFIALFFQLGFASWQESYPVKAFERESLVSSLPGAEMTWRIPGISEAKQDALGKFGTLEKPLFLLDSAGGLIGEVYQVRSTREYRGFVVISKESPDRAKGTFFDKDWPLDRVASEIELADMNDPLQEPEFFLVRDEDKLMLHVNIGTRERELEIMQLDPNEFQGPTGRVKIQGPKVRGNRNW